MPPLASLPQLVIQEHQDYTVNDEKQLPFKLIKTLGNGHSAIVEMIHDTRSGQIFARKTIQFSWARLKAQKQKQFKDEVSIIRSLGKHHHVIRVFATYAARGEFVLLLQPAADEGNLEQYLGAYRNATEAPTPSGSRIDEMASILERAFGCLANGLAYIHSKGIRHKDIKPQNILLHRGSVIYADFGSSKDATVSGQSTTEGITNLTRRYSPPEVLSQGKRNWAADIYSLGCVFVEIFVALTRAITYDHEQMFSTILDTIHKELSTMRILDKWSFLPALIIDMTVKAREQRPTAKRVCNRFAHRATFFCTDCRLHCMDLKLFSEWTWSQHESRHYCYLLGSNGETIDTIWSDLAEASVPQLVVGSNDTSSETTTSPGSSTHEECDTTPGRENTAPPYEPIRQWPEISTVPPLPIDESTRLPLLHLAVSPPPILFSGFFVLGRVFRMQLPGYTVKTFIVVHNHETVLECIEIRTYSGLATTSPHANAAHHGVIYTSDKAAALLPGEVITRYSIEVATVNDECLDAASRVDYGTVYHILCTAGISEVGMVLEAHRYLIKVYANELGGRTVPRVIGGPDSLDDAASWVSRLMESNL